MIAHKPAAEEVVEDVAVEGAVAEDAVVVGIVIKRSNLVSCSNNRGVIGFPFDDEPFFMALRTLVILITLMA